MITGCWPVCITRQLTQPVRRCGSPGSSRSRFAGRSAYVTALYFSPWNVVKERSDRRFVVRLVFQRHIFFRFNRIHDSELHPLLEIVLTESCNWYSTCSNSFR